MFLRRILLPAFVCLLCTGCIQIRETIQLRSDGSGSVHMTVTFPQLGLRWLPGKPIADWIRPHLPDGVRLASFKNAQSKIKFKGSDGKEHDLVAEVYDLDMSFDRIETLNDIRVRPDVRNAKAAAAGGTPGKMEANMMASRTNQGPNIGPFQKLTLTEEDGLLRFRRLVQAARDPEEIAAARMNTPGSSAKPAAYDLQDSKMVVSIACPGEVVKHNAHQVEGRTLTWTFRLKELQQRQDRDWVIEFTCRKEGDE